MPLTRVWPEEEWSLPRPACGTQGSRAVDEPRGPEFWKSLDVKWQTVMRHCTDRESRRRLQLVHRRLTSRHRGVRESAIAELEVGGALLCAGSPVCWLPESRARSADLEAAVEGARLFVEVTAMVGAFRETHGIPAHRAWFLHDPDGPVTDGDVLIHRMLARMRQKARQLSDYAAPVVLVLSVPPQEDVPPRRIVAVPLDVRRLVGAVTAMLLTIRHLSGVLLSLWDVKPLPATSAVRLANVALVERTLRQRDHPHVRAFIGNPGARSPATRAQDALLRALL